MSTKPLADFIPGRGFDRYQSGLTSRYEAYHFHYSLTYCDSPDNPAMLLEFESTIHVGRVTLWEPGERRKEVVENSTDTTVFSEHHTFSSEKEFFDPYPRLPVFVRQCTLGW